MIINTDHIRKCKTIALNINDISRLEPYIIEVENLWVMPAFTPELYYKIDQVVTKDTWDRPITDNDNKVILATPGDYEILIQGGYYDTNKKHCVGLISAEAYLAYSRLVLQNSINVTAFGVVQKTSESSIPVEDAALVRSSKAAEKIGREYLQQCVDYIDFMELSDGLDTEIPRRRRKFKAIG